MSVCLAYPTEALSQHGLDLQRRRITVHQNLMIHKPNCSLFTKTAVYKGGNGWMVLHTSTLTGITGLVNMNQIMTSYVLKHIYFMVTILSCCGVNRVIKNNISFVKKVHLNVVCMTNGTSMATFEKLIYVLCLC